MYEIYYSKGSRKNSKFQSHNIVTIDSINKARIFVLKLLVQGIVPKVKYISK